MLRRSPGENSGRKITGEITRGDHQRRSPEEITGRRSTGEITGEITRDRSLRGIACFSRAEGEETVGAHCTGSESIKELTRKEDFGLNALCTGSQWRVPH